MKKWLRNVLVEQKHRNKDLMDLINRTYSDTPTRNYLNIQSADQRISKSNEKQPRVQFRLNMQSVSSVDRESVKEFYRNFRFSDKRKTNLINLLRDIRKFKNRQLISRYKTNLNIADKIISFTKNHKAYKLFQNSKISTRVPKEPTSPNLKIGDFDNAFGALITQRSST